MNIIYLLSISNLILFIFYLYSHRKDLGFMEGYSFNWMISLLSFELFPYYLDQELSDDVQYAYYSFFISSSIFLIMFKSMKFKLIKNSITYAVDESKFENIIFLKWCFKISLLFIILTLTSRYFSGTLVLGVNYQEKQNVFFQVINYLLMLFGFNHTGYWFYMGLFSISFCIGVKSNEWYYLKLSLLLMVLVSALTTQKTYFLFAVIVFFISIIYKNRSLVNQVLYGFGLGSIATAIIVILNNMRYLKKENQGGVFDYIDLDTVIWYMNLRLDYAASSAHIIANPFIDFFDYTSELMKSLFFFLPKSVLFSNEMYGIKIAQIIAFSDNEKSGVSFIPYAHFFQMGGVGLVVLLAFFMSVLYHYYSQMVGRKTIYTLYYIYMVPFIYYTSLTAALHENIYTLLRASFSFFIFLFFCKLTFDFKIKLR